MRTCLSILLVITMLTACDNDSSTSDTHTHDNVSGVREAVWPPEPIGMEDEQQLPAQQQPRARRSVVEIARRSIMNNPELLAAIGDNYGTFEASLSAAKSDDVASFVFYNYDNDQTVEAVLRDDGTVSVVSQPASQWQPTENAAEVERAISLARMSLISEGFILNDLKGTARLTYPPQASSEEAPPNFYDTRLLYVTFGSGDGEPPLYSAHVDIGSGVTTEGGFVR